MAEDQDERTESATGRRRMEARDQGRVARSLDLTAATGLLAALVLLNVFGGKLVWALKRVLESMLQGEFAENPTKMQGIEEGFWFAARLVAEALLPLLLSMAAVAIAINIYQVGWRITPDVLAFNLGKLSPFKGFRGLIDLRAGIRLAMSMAKMTLIMGIATWLIVGQASTIAGLSGLGMFDMFRLSCDMIYGLGLKLAALLLGIAVLDYSYQKWQYEKDLRMTKQEVKEEMKMMEGDPKIKQRRARVARQLALQRIQSAVPKADVIVTNPTHFAIALQYDTRTMKAPKVIAKGADYMAMRIRQLAALHEVPIVERKELARALHKNVEVGQEVPPQFYNAVAEILAYVYRIAGRPGSTRRRAGGEPSAWGDQPAAATTFGSLA